MSDSESKAEKKLVTIKNATDLQRLRLEKLMKNPDKPVVIPERPRDKALSAPPDFVRNVMGSSAGAGSGEFHVYRHLRRKEYARQKFIQEKTEKEKLDEEYHRKIEENKKKVEEKTAKKRAKRLRKKKNAKLKGKKPKIDNQSNNMHVSSQSDSSYEKEDDKEKTECQIIDVREQVNEVKINSGCKNKSSTVNDTISSVDVQVLNQNSREDCKDQEQSESQRSRAK